MEKNILPPDFDGVFRFTNWTDSDFTAKWDNVAYTFPKLSTTPIIIASASPEQVQHIRKKFAKELAEQEFYKSDKLKKLESMNYKDGVPQASFNAAVSYNPGDLNDYVQRCLEPLPVAKAVVEKLPTQADKEEVIFKKDRKGKKVSQIIDSSESLVGDGTVMSD